MTAESAQPTQQFTLTCARTRAEKSWNQTRHHDFEAFASLFAKHDVRADKDGLCNVPAILLGGQRNIKSVSKVFALVYDMDGGQALDDVKKRVGDANIAAFVHTTHSHRSTQTEIPTDDYAKWAKKTGMPEGPTLEFLAQYFADKAKPWMADRDMSFDDMAGYRRVAGKGNVWIVEHAPLDKVRVIFPLSESVDIGALAASNKEANEKYRAIYRGVGKMLGLDFDVACSDPTRLYYFPSCPETTKAEARAYVYDGGLLDWRSVAPDVLPTIEPVKSTEEAGTFGSFNLKAWLKHYGKTWRIVDALGGDGEKFTVECPFEDEHTEAGGTGTFVSNPDPDMDYGFGVYCAHTSCLTSRAAQKGNGVDRLPYLLAWLESGGLSVADLENAELGGGKVPTNGERSTAQTKKPTRDEIRAEITKLKPESTSDDWTLILDMLVRLGDAAFNVEAFDLMGKATGKRMKTALEKALKQRRKVRPQSTDELQQIAQGRKLFLGWQAQYSSYADVCNAAWSAIVERDKPRRLFRTEAGVVRLIKSPENGQLIVRKMSKAEMRHEITRATAWADYDADGIPNVTPTPDAVAEHMWTDPSPPLDYLAGLTDAPFFTKDGELITTEGYHEASQIYYKAPDGFALGLVPVVAKYALAERDTYLQTALALFKERALVDFPFFDGDDKPKGVESASFANHLAKTLTPFVREMIDGPTPIFVTNKPLTGTGGSLLTDAFAVTAFGHLARSDTAPKTSEEWRKSIQTKVLEGRRHYLYGNIHDTIADDTLAEATTADYLDFRKLGSHESGGGKVRGIWDFVGNNVRFSAEIARRVVPVNLNANVEEASERTDFTIRYLKPWLTEYRPSLVMAVLTIISEGLARRPSDWRSAPQTKLLQSYEDWSLVVGSILSAVGVNNFLGNLESAKDKTVGSTDDVKGLLAVWWQTFGDSVVKVGALSFDAKPIDLPKGGPQDISGLCLLHKDALGLSFLTSKKPDGWAWEVGRLLGGAEDRTFYLDEKKTTKVRLVRPRTTKERLGWKLEQMT